MNEGFIKLARRLLDWEWYSDINTTRLFVHLLLRANWETGYFQGREVDRGCLITSLASLSRETGLSIQQIRTALNHLRSTGEITTATGARYTKISINNYRKYQDYNTPVNSEPTENQQADEQPINNNIRKEEYKNKEYKKKRVSKDTPKEKHGEITDDIISQYDFSEQMRAKIDEWLEYKRERREAYKSTGLGALLKKISQKSGEAGENPVMALMDECMANGWRGIIWDKLKAERDGNNGDKGDKGNNDDDDWDKYLKGGLTV